MRSYEWPGNIRELKNVIERAVILSKGDTLQLDITGMGAGRMPSSLPAMRESSGNTTERSFYTEKELKLQQRDNMRRALEYADWRISGKDGAAELLGLKASTLTDRMRAFGLSKIHDGSRKRADS